MAIKQLFEKIEHFEQKSDIERDIILRDCMLGLFLDNKLMTERIIELEKWREMFKKGLEDMRDGGKNFEDEVERLHNNNRIRIDALERKIVILQNKCKVSFI